MNVAVIGAGYVGLVSGVGLAAREHRVTCLDVRADVVDRLNRGEPTIHERGLPELLRDVREAGRFQASVADPAALAGAEMVILAVGTPSLNGVIDLTSVKAAAALAAEHVRRTPSFVSVVVKSTVVPGTTDTTVREILESHSGKRLSQFGLGMNPEFLREGEAVEDFMNPDRIVLGHDDPETLRVLAQLYAPWDCEKIIVNTRTAEMIKYASNALLAVQISTANELANIAAAVGGIDPMDVVRGIQLDRRWNPSKPDGTRVAPAILSYLTPGCGFGGSCFPKDVAALVGQANTLSVPARVLRAVVDVNDQQPFEVTGLLESALGSLADRRVLVLGLAFKPGTDDVRESPALKMIRWLVQRGALVTANDPVAMANARASLVDVTLSYTDNWRAAVEDAEAVLIATSWPEYRGLATENQALRGKVIVDPRRLFGGGDFPESQYRAIGYSSGPRGMAVDV